MPGPGGDPCEGQGRGAHIAGRSTQKCPRTNQTPGSHRVPPALCLSITPQTPLHHAPETKHFPLWPKTKYFEQNVSVVPVFIYGVYLWGWERDGAELCAGLWMELGSCVGLWTELRSCGGLWMELGSCVGLWMELEPCTGLWTELGAHTGLSCAGGTPSSRDAARVGAGKKGRTQEKKVRLCCNG